MKVTIRKENRTDYDKVYGLVKAAFCISRARRRHRARFGE